MIYPVSDIKVHADQKRSIVRSSTFRGSVIISRHLADCGRRSFFPCPVFAKDQGSCLRTFSYFAHDDHMHEKIRSENKTAPYTSAARPQRSTLSFSAFMAEAFICLAYNEMYSISSSIFVIAKPHLFAPLLTETAHGKGQRSYCSPWSLCSSSFHAESSIRAEATSSWSICWSVNKRSVFTVNFWSLHATSNRVGHSSGFFLTTSKMILEMTYLTALLNYIISRVISQITSQLDLCQDFGLIK